jgi:hypothetical protein
MEVHIVLRPQFKMSSFRVKINSQPKHTKSSGGHYSGQGHNSSQGYKKSIRY